MAWIKLSDSFSRDSKFRFLRKNCSSMQFAAAVGFWALLLESVGSTGGDGTIDVKLAEQLLPDVRAARKCLTHLGNAGLLEGGNDASLSVPNWARYNPPRVRATKEQRSRAAAENGRRGGLARKQNRIAKQICSKFASDNSTISTTCASKPCSPEEDLKTKTQPPCTEVTKLEGEKLAAVKIQASEPVSTSFDALYAKVKSEGRVLPDAAPLASDPDRGRVGFEKRPKVQTAQPIPKPMAEPKEAVTQPVNRHDVEQALQTIGEADPRASDVVFARAARMAVTGREIWEAAQCTRRAQKEPRGVRQPLSYLLRVLENKKGVTVAGPPIDRKPAMRAQLGNIPLIKSLANAKGV